MRRRALIIANPGTRGEEGYCHGVARDVDNYKAFLTSAVGGLWSKDEIVVLEQPSRTSTTDEIRRQQNSDYSLTVFCGHGYHAANSNSTLVELKPGVDMDSVELRRGASKHTLILDCCRVLHRTMIAEDSAIRIQKRAASTINPVHCRKYYDEKMDACPSGIVVLFGCSINETAGDSDAQGGVYSYSLLNSAEAWSRDTFVDTSESYKTLSVAKAHDIAISRVTMLSGGRQNPKIEKPRSEPYFPLCIIA